MSILVIVEGGGDANATRRHCREGFSNFFSKAGLMGRMPKVKALGGRDQAFHEFCNEINKAVPNQLTILLVDSEGPVTETRTAWQHLSHRDNWERPAGVTDNQVHLMVQIMESWFLADKDCLADYFGQGFNSQALPSNLDIEAISKQDILDKLEAATRQCVQKGSYSKGKHSFEILAAIDPGKVIAASPHASQLIDILKAKAGL